MSSRTPSRPSKPKAKTAKKAPASRTSSKPSEPKATAAKKTAVSSKSRETAGSGPGKSKATAAKKTAASGKPRTVAVEEGGSRADPAVIAFLRDLEHPLKREIETVRQLILDASPAIREGIKWNAPSFLTTDHFATFNLRTPDRLRLILHTGAKTKETAKTGVKVEDPAGLLEWLAKDRCLVTFRDGKDIQARGAALQALLQDWMKFV